jgi:glycosyltransferase involved in cell wall biosynthesis
VFKYIPGVKIIIFTLRTQAVNPITFHTGQSPKNPIFSVLIPSWNNLPYLKTCVDSIRKNSTFPHQIIVHVNEGSDGTLEWVNEQNLDHTYSAKNAGVCYGFNAPSFLAKTDFILLSDDDLYFAPGWDDALLDEAKLIKGQPFCISGTMIEHTITRNSCVIAPHDFGKTVDAFDEKRFLSEYQRLQFHDWCGSNWYPLLLDRSMWNLIGGLSVEFSPGMGSDPDMMMKLWNAGVRYYKGVGRSRVYHFGSKTTGRIVRNNGNRQFLDKWGMSISTFYKYYLRMGKPFDGKSVEPTMAGKLKARLLRDRVKKKIGLS